jgi:hypothetical protein
MKSCSSREPFAIFAKKHAVCLPAVLVKIAKRNQVKNYMMGHIFVGGFQTRSNTIGESLRIDRFKYVVHSFFVFCKVAQNTHGLFLNFRIRIVAQPVEQTLR